MPYWIALAIFRTVFSDGSTGQKISTKILMREDAAVNNSNNNASTCREPISSSNVQGSKVPLLVAVFICDRWKSRPNYSGGCHQDGRAPMANAHLMQPDRRAWVDALRLRGQQNRRHSLLSFPWIIGIPVMCLPVCVPPVLAPWSETERL